MSHIMNRTPARKADHTNAGWLAKTGAFVRSPMQTLTAVALGAGLLATTGALNGGTLPPASAFTPLKTWLQTNFLGSDWVLLMGFVALIALIWGLVHGKGWGAASIVLGLLTAALLGPTMVIAAATATRAPTPIVQQLHQVPQAAVAGVLTAKSTSAPLAARI
jgi:hypothetical protein